MDEKAYKLHLEHDSEVDLQKDCVFCVSETYRRSHKCFGDGASTLGIQRGKGPNRKEDSQKIEPQPYPEIEKGKPIITTPTAEVEEP